MIAVLFINSRKGNSVDVSGSENISNKARQTAQGILKDLSALENFFIDKKLEQFEEYSPIHKPDTHGRENPFDAL